MVRQLIDSSTGDPLVGNCTVSENSSYKCQLYAVKLRLLVNDYKVLTGYTWENITTAVMSEDFVKAHGSREGKIYQSSLLMPVALCSTSHYHLSDS